MSSFETNSFTTKPAIQVSMSKPILQAGIIVSKEKTEPQQKRAQPLMRPVFNCAPAKIGNKATVSHSISKSSRVHGEVRHSTVEVTRKPARQIPASAAAININPQRIINQINKPAVASPYIPTMGNEQTRHTSPNVSQHGGHPSNTVIQQPPHGANTVPMASIMSKTTEPSKLGSTTITPVIATGPHTNNITIPRVVSTPSRMINQGNGMTARPQIPHTAAPHQPSVIQAPRAHISAIPTSQIKNTSLPHVRSTTPLNRPSNTGSPSATVQIRIQNQQRTEKAVPQARYSGQQPVKQLVITQNAGSQGHHNKPSPHIPDTRVITTAPYTPGPRPRVGRPAIFSGQHDYSRDSSYTTVTAQIRKVSHPSDNRPSVTVHTVTEAAPTSLYNTVVSQTSAVNSISTSIITQTANNQTTIGIPPTIRNTTPLPISNTINAQTVRPPTVFTRLPEHNPGTIDVSTGASSPRPSPSILKRKRTHDFSPYGVPNARKQLLGTQPSSPMKITAVPPVERDTNSQSSTDTAGSHDSPINNAVSFVKTEPSDMLELSRSGSIEVSPRKKPRKQLLNAESELKDKQDSSTEEETETKQILHPTGVKLDPGDELNAEIKKEFVDRDGVRWVKMRDRCPDQLLSYYNCSWRARYNHFHKRTEIKLKEERRPVVSEIANQRNIHQKASGWRFYHLSAQFYDMSEYEHSIKNQMSRVQNLLSNGILKDHPELTKIHELSQANKQRCSLTIDQLKEAKSSMFSILNSHKPKITEIINKNHSKRPVKKKDRL